MSVRSSNILLAGVQPPVLDGLGPEQNACMIERGFGWAEEAFALGAQYVCLPEFFNVFGLPVEQMVAAAQTDWEPILSRAGDLAARFRAHMVLPMLVPGDGCTYSRAFLLGPNGTVISHYDKLHPTLGEKERLGLAAGDAFGVFETVHGRLAIVICYDIYFPELFVALAKQRPDVIFFPSLQRSEREHACEAMVKTRAMDTGAFIVRASFGREAGQAWQPGMMFGLSCVVHPDGSLLANAGHHEGVALAKVSLPATWSRPRCGGYPSMPVRDFLAEDRRTDLFNL
jgi:predicted amidohydrolase